MKRRGKPCSHLASVGLGEDVQWRRAKLLMLTEERREKGEQICRDVRVGVAIGAPLLDVAVAGADGAVHVEQVRSGEPRVRATLAVYVERADFLELPEASAARTGPTLQPYDQRCGVIRGGRVGWGDSKLQPPEDMREGSDGDVSEIFLQGRGIPRRGDVYAAAVDQGEESGHQQECQC